MKYRRKICNANNCNKSTKDAERVKQQTDKDCGLLVNNSHSLASRSKTAKMIVCWILISLAIQYHLSFSCCFQHYSCPSNSKPEVAVSFTMKNAKPNSESIIGLILNYPGQEMQHCSHHDDDFNLQCI